MKLNYYKLGQKLLQSRAGNLLQSESIFIAKQSRYYKVGQLYYKVKQVLQSEVTMTEKANTSS